jgi:hypothetical protein
VDVDGVGDDSYDGYEHVVKAGISILFRSGGDQYDVKKSRPSESRRQN